MKPEENTSIDKQTFWQSAEENRDSIYTGGRLEKWNHMGTQQEKIRHNKSGEAKLNKMHM